MLDYNEELAKKYTTDREKYTITDDRVFSELKKISLVGKDVLDFGCGDAVYSVKLSELGAKSVTGIDVSSSMIELAEQRLKTSQVKNVKVLVGDGNNLPFENNSFDIVFSNFVFHYFFDTLKPFVEIERMLRPGGFLLAMVQVYNLKSGTENLINTEVPIRLGSRTESITPRQSRRGMTGGPGLR